MFASRLGAAFLLLAGLCTGNAYAQSCVSDEDCQDGSWCNGIERCEGNPGQQLCMPAPRPMCSAKKECDEAAKACRALDASRLQHTCAKDETWSARDGKCVAKPPR